MKKHFDILGLKQDASQEQIQEAYDRLSKELNPSNNDNQAFFKEEYEKVQEAYKAISKSSILKNNNSFRNAFFISVGYRNQSIKWLEEQKNKAINLLSGIDKYIKN